MAQKTYVSLNNLSTFLDNIKAESDTKYATKDELSQHYIDEQIFNRTIEDLEAKLDETKSYADNAAVTVKNDLLNGADEAYDTLKELGDLIDINVDAIDALEEVAANTTNKVNTLSGILQDITSGVITVPFADEAIHDGMGNVIAETYETITDSATKITAHNTDNEAHNDIRNALSNLSTQVNQFLDVDDATKDQLSEVLALIDNNKGTLDSLTTSKVNVSDIVDNLTTADTKKVLSANQGVAIQAQINGNTDAIQEIVGDISEMNAKLETKVLKVSVATNDTTTMSAIITAIEEAEGKVSDLNLVQLSGRFTERLIMRMESRGTNRYKIYCTSVDSLTLIYDSTNDNVVDVTTTTIGAFLSSKISLKDVSEKTIDKIAEIDTWYAGVSSLQAPNEGGIQWNDGFSFIDTAGNDLRTGTIQHRVPIMAGDNVTFTLDERGEYVKISVPAIGDISTALDSIIAQTNAIIGGAE